MTNMDAYKQVCNADADIVSGALNGILCEGSSPPMIVTHSSGNHGQVWGRRSGWRSGGAMMTSAVFRPWHGPLLRWASPAPSWSPGGRPRSRWGRLRNNSNCIVLLHIMLGLWLRYVKGLCCDIRHDGMSVTLQVAVLKNCFPQCWFLMKPIIEWDRGDWYQLRIVMIVSAVYY